MYVSKRSVYHMGSICKYKIDIVMTKLIIWIFYYLPPDYPKLYSLPPKKKKFKKIQTRIVKSAQFLVPFILLSSPFGSTYS